MNITPWQMYWLTRLDSINGLLAAIGMISGMGLFFLILTKSIDRDKFQAQYLKWAVVPFLCAMICSLIPTTKEMAAIIVVPKIVNNQKVQEIPSKLLDLATAWLDELKPKESK